MNFFFIIHYYKVEQVLRTHTNVVPVGVQGRFDEEGWVKYRAHYRQRCFHTPWDARCSHVSVLRAVVSRGCMLSAAALEGTQGSKHIVISLVIRLWGNILYTEKVVE